jgi:hypothetical protein
MTPYQQFGRLLYGACFAAEVVDHFDLRSEQPANLAVWNWLLHERHEAEIALLRYVQANGAAIIAGMPRVPDAPAEPPALALRAADLIDAGFVFVTKYALEAAATAWELDGIGKAIQPAAQIRARAFNF